MRPDFPLGQNVRIKTESMSFAPNPVERHVWTRSKQKWLVCPPGAEIFEKGSPQQQPSKI